MKKRFNRMFLALDGTPPGAPPPPADIIPPTPPTPPVIDLDYTKFDSKMNETVDPSGLATTAFADKAKELGISVAAAKDLFKTVDDSIGASKTKYAETASERCKTSLEATWGDKFEVNNNALKRGHLKLTETNPTLKKELEANGLLDSPLVARLMSTVGNMFKEDSQQQGQFANYDAKDPYSFAKNENK